MAKHIFTGSAAPATTPSDVGHHYVDTVAKKHYVSVGTASSADWVEIVTSVVNFSDFAEATSDQIGTMLTGNTETGITVTYQDADNTIDFVVPDLTVAGDSGSTGMTPGDTLTIAGGTNCTSAMSGDTLTLNVEDAFLLNTGDVGTGVYDLGGASSLEIPNSAAPTVDSDGEIALDTTVADFSHGVVKYFGGEEMGVVAMPIAQFTTPMGGGVVAYNSTNDEFELIAVGGTGTVTSVAISGTDGIDIDSGSPVTSSGTITLGVNATTLRTHINVENGADVTDAANVAAAGSIMDSDYSTNGVQIRTASGTYTSRTITGTAGQIDVADGTGVSGNPTLSLPSTIRAGQIGIVVDGAGSAITTGVKGYIRVPYACTVTAWHIVAKESGSVVVDVWKDSYANFPPTVADTIAGTEKPTLSSAQKNQDTSLSTWTDTTLTEDEWLAFNVDSATTVTQVTVILEVTRT